MNYKTYAEAKIANTDCEIFSNGVGFSAIKNSPTSHFCNAWVTCNPADYCSTLKEFLEAGFKLVGGDKFIGVHGNVIKVKAVVETNMPNTNDCDRYILSAAALNGGCKIQDKTEQWTIYNNTMPLSELTDEQAAQLFNAWRAGENMQVLNDDDEWKDYDSGFYPLDVYRIKSKSERELFIEHTAKVMRDAGTKYPDNHEYFGIMFDAGARYKDLTQYFGENI